MKKYSGFFVSDAWVSVIQRGFSTVVTRVAMPGNTSCPVFVFKKGPFKLAYPHFPSVVAPEELQHLVEQAEDSELNFHLMRCLTREFPKNAQGFVMIAEQPETIVHQLQEFDPQKDNKLKRAIRRANRFDTKITRDPETLQANVLYDMYRTTINARRGNLRYNLPYFEELLRVSRTSDDLSILVACTENKLSGFLVVAIDNEEAHYLHSAYDRDFGKHGITDLLVEQAFIYAKENGANAFNFGVSPVNQPELTRFKEKWGGVTSTQYTLEYTGHKFWGGLLKMAIRILSLKNFLRN